MVGEEARLASLDNVVNGDIKHDDPSVGLRLFGLEFTIGKITVHTEFLQMVREGESHCFGSEMPS